MIIEVPIKRALLLAVLLQTTVWFTACDALRFLSMLPGREDPASAKTIRIHSIAPSIEVSQAVMNLIINESNGKSVVRFRQEGEKIFVETDGLYIAAVFNIASDSSEMKRYILEGKTLPEDMARNGLACALMKISGGTATGRILNLSGEAREVGTFWKGGGRGSSFSIGTLLITPDARFLLQADFSLGNICISPNLTTSTLTIDYSGYDGTLPKYEVNFENAFVLNGDLKLVKNPALPSNQGGDMINVFSGYGYPHLPRKMLTDNFVEDIMNEFS
jgi:hypothetical protein